jgi:hypothetical protein
VVSLTKLKVVMFVVNQYDLGPRRMCPSIFYHIEAECQFYCIVTISGAVSRMAILTDALLEVFLSFF